MVSTTDPNSTFNKAGDNPALDYPGCSVILSSILSRADEVDESFFYVDVFGEEGDG